MTKRISFLFMILFWLSVPSAIAQTNSSRSLNLDGARQVIVATMQKANDLKAPGGTIAVVDSGGNLIALERLDGTFAASANVSIGKARTAALFKKPTKFFEEVVNTKGRTTMVALNDFTPLQGGVPIMIQDEIVGAVGVSGAASADQDEELAQAGAAAFAMMEAPQQTLTAATTTESLVAVTHLDHTDVAKAWEKGMPLIENEQFKIHASRRDMPGMAEVHDDETDIVYVVSGQATLVTGGTVMDPKMTGPGETRGSSIQGGQTSQLCTGDVVVVPRGVPHWFKEIDGPFLYFVVKPISHDGANK